MIRVVTSAHATPARERKLVRCGALDAKKGKGGYSFHSVPTHCTPNGAVSKSG